MKINFSEEWSTQLEWSSSRLGEAERWAAVLPSMRVAACEAMDMVERLMAQTKSPIEELFAAALWANPKFSNKTAYEEALLVCWRADPSAPEALEIRPQMQVGPYSADFHLTLKWMGLARSVVVELDGHDFHEKTKKQAAHDKKRDRFFAAEGLTVLRFTGSEITKDAAACAEEVCRLLSARMTEASKEVRK